MKHDLVIGQPSRAAHPFTAAACRPAAYCVASLYPLCLGIFMILEYGLKLN